MTWLYLTSAMKSGPPTETPLRATPLFSALDVEEPPMTSRPEPSMALTGPPRTPSSTPDAAGGKAGSDDRVSGLQGISRCVAPRTAARLRQLGRKVRLLSFQSLVRLAVILKRDDDQVVSFIHFTTPFRLTLDNVILHPHKKLMSETTLTAMHDAQGGLEMA
jgi:hypothetical protein